LENVNKIGYNKSHRYRTIYRDQNIIDTVLWKDLKVAVKIFDYFFVSKSFHAALEDNKKNRAHKPCKTTYDSFICVAPT